jgi:hypothetical protein
MKLQSHADDAPLQVMTEAQVMTGHLLNIQ